MAKNIDWTKKSANFQSGCEHGCLYCYARAMAAKFGQKDPSDWENVRIREKDLLKNFPNFGETVMFPSSHDITPNNLENAIRFLERLLIPGNQVLVVSKPSFECIKQICDKFESYKDQLLFRFTIGSVSDGVLKFWEPNAPTFKERLKSLEYAFKKGFDTSVSCEPMLDNRIDKVIEKVEPLVTETIWLGKANRLLGKTGKGRLEVNGVLTEETKRKAEELNEWQDDENILKLYNQLKDNPKIRWKESIRNIIENEGTL